MDGAKQLRRGRRPERLRGKLTVLGQPDEDLVAIQSQWAEAGITLNFVTATSTDQLFAAVNTDPLLWGPFAVGAQPAGFIAGVVYGGFMNTKGRRSRRSRRRWARPGA